MARNISIDITAILERVWKNTPHQNAWRAGEVPCPECARPGCRGQCGCVCEGCKSTPVDAWVPECCEVIRDIRERSTPEGAAAQRARYLEEARGRKGDRVTWGQCAFQIERAGAPHESVAAAKEPKSNRVLEFSKHWWSEKRRSHPALVLADDTGVGKTVAAAHLAMKFAQVRRWWVNQPSGGAPREAFVWLKADELASHALLTDEDQANIAAAEKCELLVIDEVPVIGQAAGLQAVARVLAHRLDSGRLMILTTNATGLQFKTALGPHVVDRMKNAWVMTKKSGEPSKRGAA